MVDVKEHIYNDDPGDGHPDVKTRLKDVSYFFIGNGLIQAAIQYSPEGEGTPLGILIMNPEILAKKRDALTFDTETGLSDTQLVIRNAENDEIYSAEGMTVKWSGSSNVPMAAAEWKYEGFSIRESFFCHDNETASITREIEIESKSSIDLMLTLSTGIRGEYILQDIDLPESAKKLININYTLDPVSNHVAIELVEGVRLSDRWLDFWNNGSTLYCRDKVIDHFFKTACYQLPSVISQNGKMDASIWQYNREWVRDQSFVVMALLYLGRFKLAKTIVSRLIEVFVSDEGDTVDSSEKRSWEDVELDQNGVLLYTLEQYVLWTGDQSIVEKYWDKIVSIADFPFGERFFHRKSGLLHNNREYWERHAAHGIEPGFEFAYQVFNVLGLNSAAYMAETIGKQQEAKRWLKRATKLKNAVLNHPKYSMVNDKGFVKRLGLDGIAQDKIDPLDDSGVPSEAPLGMNKEHSLNPDSSTVLAIVYSFISPDSDIARKTLDSIEFLWNQEWDTGGYGRYNVTSEPDSAGSWPFASVFIARAYMETGGFDKIQRVLDWLNAQPDSLSGSWFEYYGPRIAPPFPQNGIIPWTWAEIILLIMRHILGIKLDSRGIHFRPRLLPGMENLSGDILVRENRIKIDIKRDSSKSILTLNTNGNIVDSDDEGIVLDFADNDIFIEAVLPDK